MTTDGAHSRPDRPGAILETRGLRKSFAGFVAVDGLDLRIEHNAIHALIGPNGAGKTTVFNLLTRFLDPTDGTIHFDGIDATRTRPSVLARRGLVRSFQISSIFPAMTVRENVTVALQRKLDVSMHFWRSQRCLRHLDPRADELLEQVGLARFGDMRAADLSYGRRRALELAATLALEPKVMLLDEPMAGLGHDAIHRIADLIRRVAVGRTVVMVEHNLSVVADLCNRITVLMRGRILAEGSYDEIARDPAVRTAYTGGAHV